MSVPPARPTASYDASPHILKVTIHRDDGLQMPLDIQQVDITGEIQMPHDVTAYDWWACVLEANSDDVLALLDVDFDPVETNRLNVSIKAADVTFPVGVYRWFLQATDHQTGTPQAWLHGPFEVVD